jgi:hypothetical protein
MKGRELGKARVTLDLKVRLEKVLRNLYFICIHNCLHLINTLDSENKRTSV